MPSRLPWKVGCDWTTCTAVPMQAPSRQLAAIITCTYMHIHVDVYMNNHVYRTPFSDIERKKEVAKS